VRHVYDCPIRWADLDLLGHINNVVYVDYLQEARVDMLRVHARDQRSDDLAEGVVVVRHEVEYVRPLEFRFAPVRIETWVTEIRAASFTLAYEVVDQTAEERVVHLRASTVLAPFVFGSERPRRITPEERATLEPYLGERLPRRDVGGWQRPPAAPLSADHFPLRVRWSDVDAYGHVNNVKYFEYVQEARIPLLAALGRGLPSGLGERSVVAQTDMAYKQPVLFSTEPYDCVSWVSRVGDRSLELLSEIRGGDQVLAQARVVLVWFDPATGRSAALPASVREAAQARMSGA
jgi:acyl-CoA thioester hydrolase